jgi:2-C-methyl-D-erythritol 4-phosphate cytidylyltransferase/2-C-methyl-D-erythritol 2,4-cyclodiphosphate synthase
MGGIQKQLERIGALPMWQWSVRTASLLHLAGIVRECVLVVPDGEENKFANDIENSMSLNIVPGGKERAESVLNGISACSSDIVLIHDAARPFASKDLFVSIAEKASETNGAIPVCRVTDALKRYEDSSLQSIDRECLYAAQTPQGFGRKRLAEAIESYGFSGKDEAEAWTSRRNPVSLVPGERGNIKITFPEDLVLARKLVEKNGYRTGTGFDVHPLKPGRKLILGGVTIPSPLGLDGHSDADIVAHTVADALLGAAGEPDIGLLYPASDPAFKGADSMLILRDAVVRIRNRGWIIKWVDIVLSAQYPRLAPYLDSIRGNLSLCLSEDADVRNVNIKIKSGEGIGAVGTGKCMECSAVATVERMPGFAGILSE